MRKWTAAVILAGAMASVAVYAAPPDHSVIPTPGTKNCEGQLIAYLAQGNETLSRGIGNVAREAGFPSVKDLHDFVRAYCNP